MMSMGYQFFEKAVEEPSAAMRMVWVATHNASQYYLVKGRTAKPFNAMLGETYELVTPNFKLVTEAVCHHPPIVSMNCEGKGWTLNKSVQTNIKFTGKQVQIEDIFPIELDLFPESLNGQKESYVIQTPKLVIGNLMIGERFIEPYDTVTIKNQTSGEYCEMTFKQRSGGWRKEVQAEMVSAKVFDKNGSELFQIERRYTDKLVAKDLRKQGEEIVLFEAPPMPPRHK